LIEDLLIEDLVCLFFDAIIDYDYIFIYLLV
jgi:hypothetical protein